MRNTGKMWVVEEKIEGRWKQLRYYSKKRYAESRYNKERMKDEVSK